MADWNVEIFVKGTFKFVQSIEEYLTNQGVAYNIAKLIPNDLKDEIIYGFDEDVKLIRNVQNVNSFVYIREYNGNHLIEKSFEKNELNDLLRIGSQKEKEVLLKWFIQATDDMNEKYYLKLATSEFQLNFEDDEKDFQNLKNLFMKRRKSNFAIKMDNTQIEFEVFFVKQNSIESVRNVSGSEELMNRIQEFFSKDEKKNETNEETEAEYHLNFCRLKIKNFIGRSNEIRALIEILRKKSNKPLIIHGLSGCGKTTMMAYLASNLKKWTFEPNKEVKIILRLIGITKESQSIQNISLSIIKELNKEYGVDYDQDKVTPDYLFKYLITVSQKFPNTFFYLLLDSLDQLSDENEAKKLNWFPNETRCSNLKIIVSTLRESEHEAYPALHNMFLGSTELFFSLGEFESSDIEELISKNFNTTDDSENNRLNQLRIDFVREASRVSSIPIYLKMIVDTARTFSSFNRQFESSETSPDLIIEKLFDKLENMINKTNFVKNALTFITLSRFGFSFEHLRKLMLNFFEYPDYDLMKLISSISEYLISPQYRWYHRIFFTAAKYRYCPIKETNKDFHCFIFKTFESNAMSNKFWINELPYHTIYANELNKLKNLFLLNLNFMEIKIQLIEVDALISDFSYAVQEYPNEFIFEILYRTLLLIAYKIRARPSELPGQLIARLHGLYTENTDLNTFLENCLSPQKPSIIPNKRFMAFATRMNQGEPILSHKDEICTIRFTDDEQSLVTCQVDKTVNIFLAKRDFKFNMNYVKKSQQTRILTVSRDSSVLYFWTKSSDPQNKEEIIIEAFDLEDKKTLFEFKTGDLQDSSRTRVLFFNPKKDELWLTTKYFWYFIDWKSGKVKDKRQFSKEFSELEEKNSLSFGQYKDIIALAFDNDSNVMIAKDNQEEKIYSLGEDKIIGRRIAIAPNNKIAISVRRMYESKFGDQDFEWHVIIHDIDTFEQNIKIPVNKAVCIWHACLDARTFFCYTYNYIYILDIYEKKTKMTLEHSSQINSCTQRNDSEIICATFDKKLTVWNLNKNYDSNQKQMQLKENENINIFTNYNSRMVRFLANSHNSLSRYVLVYNFYDEDGTEMFLLFDIKAQEVVRKCRLVGYSRNDLQPLCFVLNTTILVYCDSRKHYYILSIENFEIIQTIKAAQKDRVHRKISENEIILSIETPSSSILASFQGNFTEHEILIESWELVELFTLNDTHIVYKKRNEQLFQVFDFKLRQFFQISWPLEYFEKIEIHISPGSSHLLIIKEDDDNKMKTILINSIKKEKNVFVLTKEGEFKLPKLTHKIKSKCLPKFQFINDHIFLYQFKRDFNRVTFVHDIAAKINYLWFNDDDSDGLFDCFKHNDCPYIWYQRYQVSRYNRVINDITVFHVDDLSKPFATLDADCRLKITQSTLFNNGKAFLVKELDKLQFVIFQIKSKAEKEDKIIFDDFIIKTEQENFILKF